MRYIVGVGNYAMSDDGVGLHLIEELERRGGVPGAELREIAADGLKLLSLLEPETESILLIDCMLLGLKPGEFRVFSLDDVKSVKPRQGFSTHEGDILRTIEFAAAAGYHIPEIRLMGIEPETMEQGMKLSEALRSRMPEYLAAARQAM